MPRGSDADKTCRGEEFFALKPSADPPREGKVCSLVLLSHILVNLCCCCLFLSFFFLSVDVCDTEEDNDCRPVLPHTSCRNLAVELFLILGPFTTAKKLRVMKIHFDCFCVCSAYVLC